MRNLAPTLTNLSLAMFIENFRATDLQTLQLKAVLNDAERRQFKEEVVRLWSEKLTDACYEMDDVVDKVKLAIQKQAEEDAGKAPSSPPLHVVSIKWLSSNCATILLTRL